MFVLQTRIPVVFWRQWAVFRRMQRPISFHMAKRWDSLIFYFNFSQTLCQRESIVSLILCVIAAKRWYIRTRSYKGHVGAAVCGARHSAVAHNARRTITEWPGMCTINVLYDTVHVHWQFCNSAYIFNFIQKQLEWSDSGGSFEFAGRCRSKSPQNSHRRRCDTGRAWTTSIDRGWLLSFGSEFNRTLFDHLRSGLWTSRSTGQAHSTLAAAVVHPIRVVT